MLSEELDQRVNWFRAICTRVIEADLLDLTVDLGFDITTRRRVRLSGLVAGTNPLGKQRVEDLLRPKNFPYPVPLWIQAKKGDPTPVDVWLQADRYKPPQCLNRLLIDEKLAIELAGS